MRTSPTTSTRPASWRQREPEAIESGRGDRQRRKPRIADASDRLAESVAVAHEPFADLPRQLVHGDFWDNNVLLRDSRPVLVGDFDFMAKRLRIDDLALTLAFTTDMLNDPLDVEEWRRLTALVDRYDAGSTHPLTTTERAALPVAVARQPLWSIATWAAKLDDITTARRHLRGHLATTQRGLAILAALPQYQDATTNT